MDNRVCSICGVGATKDVDADFYLLDKELYFIHYECYLDFMRFEDRLKAEAQENPIDLQIDQSPIADEHTQDATHSLNENT